MSIDRYVTGLRARLPITPSQAAEVAEEVQGHLEDAARDLQMGGLSPSESEHEAIRRFGPADEIADALVRAERARRQRRASTRGLVAAMLAAAALAALGGSAAASAYTAPPSTHGHHTQTVIARGSNVAPTLGKGGH
jgi:anti-sigma factor RsiW